MTFFEEFNKDMRHMKDYVNQINKLAEALESDVWEGLIGHLFDDLFELQIRPYLVLVDGEENRDKATEWLFRLLYDSEEVDIDDNDTKEWFETYLGHLDD